MARSAQPTSRDGQKPNSVKPGTDHGSSLSTAQTSQGLGQGNVSENLDIDPNDERRKRRRTVSPLASPSAVIITENSTWDEQLKEAAIGIRTLHGDPILLDPKEDDMSDDLRVHAKDNSSGSIMDTKDLKSTMSHPQTPEVRDSLQSSPKKPTPKKKMLKLRSDGKLGSPKAQETRINSKPRGKKKSTNNKGEPDEKVVVIRYGVDEQSRNTIGQKIEDIFNRTTIERPTLTARVERKSPAKPTHPFFLGKLVGPTDRQPTSVSEILKPDRVTSNPQSEPDPSGSPKKKVPKALGAGAAAWAALAGLGSKSTDTNKVRVSKFPGAMEPMLPPRDMLHIRGSFEVDKDSKTTSKHGILSHGDRKLKDTEVQIPGREEVLYPYIQYSRAQKHILETRNTARRHSSTLRLPHRRIMTGRELQEAVSRNLHTKLPLGTHSTSRENGSKAIPDHASHSAPFVHDSLLQVYNAMTSSLTAFDKFECENQEWTLKYAPKRATEVLQLGREVMLLRDWLRNLTVTSVDSGNGEASRTRESSVASKKFGVRAKKRRKRSEELDGFIISTDEEMDEMDEITDTEGPGLSQQLNSTIRKSLIRVGDMWGTSRPPGNTPKAANAVVISGPHGCGKTAAVYAVARELDFEVFEINAGSRRSGKDVLDKVGDMTKNHLVNRNAEDDKTGGNETQPTESTMYDREPGVQGTMASFLQPAGSIKSESRPQSSKKSASRPKVNAKKQKHQKQSLILLEEVDILFEEDKQFWVTTLELILQSKRPIIMTCTDETRLPLDEMNLYAIFRLVSPPAQLATDYLLLVAGNEGHVLSRNSVSTLYKAKHADLRASLAELNFFCQMAIGDSKGGLEWMLIRSPSNEYQNEEGEMLRVVSEGTYLEGMGFIGHHEEVNDDSKSAENSTDVLSEPLHGLSMDVGDWHGFIDTKAVASTEEQVTQQRSLKLLETIDTAFDALSAGDVFPSLGMRLDTTVSIVCFCYVYNAKTV